MITQAPTIGRLPWGRVHRPRQTVVRPTDQRALPDLLAARGDLPVLGGGLGRSYGDSALVPDGLLIDMTGLDRIVRLDLDTGILEAEAGLDLATLMAIMARHAAGSERGCLLPPVTPGTRYVTLGGAVANDVHGKNHHRAGSFGRHVLALRLLRSDGSLLECSREQNTALFRATIGGLGLTGLIVTVTLRLAPIMGPMLAVEEIPFADLDAFHALAERSAEHEHNVAWIDCQARGRSLGRGIFSRASPVPGPWPHLPLAVEPGLSVPVAPPISPLNSLTLRAFNLLYRARLRSTRQSERHFLQALYPLDAIGHWNRLYGRRGFYQHQCVVPRAVAPDAIRQLLETIAASGQGSFLAVLKTLGDHPPEGLLSFPIAGTTLALDFPNRGVSTLALLRRLDEITQGAGGRVYPAKDGRMSAAHFRDFYPGWQALERQRDPAFTSGFWQRVAGSGRRDVSA